MKLTGLRSTQSTCCGARSCSVDLQQTGKISTKQCQTPHTRVLQSHLPHTSTTHDTRHSSHYHCHRHYPTAEHASIISLRQRQLTQVQTSAMCGHTRNNKTTRNAETHRVPPHRLHRHCAAHSPPTIPIASMRAPADVKCACAASQQQHLAAAISNREELRWREATNQQQQNRDSTAPVPVSRHGERRHPPHNMQYRQQTSGHKGERPPPAGRC